MHFAFPYAFVLVVPLFLVIWRLVFKSARQGGTVKFSNLGIVKNIGVSAKQRLRNLMPLLRILTLTLIIICIARPQSKSTTEEIFTEGIDIILAMDISSSMRAEDFKPKNRLEAAKLVAKNFIKGRKNDRIGMVVFAGMSFTQCPLTLDYGILLTLLDEIEIGMIEDGTAIGMALATCVNRLKDSKAKSKVIILLTDGRNNKGQLDPVTAAQVAKVMNTKIYTIGAGKQGNALFPVNDPVFGKRYVRAPVDIDEDLLRQVAVETGGKYFRATDEKKLEDIFRAIGEMEQTKIEVKEYTRYSELFHWFLFPALLLFLLEIVLVNTIFRKIP